MGEQKIPSESSPKPELKSSSLEKKEISTNTEQKEKLQEKLVVEIIVASHTFSSPEWQEQFQVLLKSSNCADAQLQKLKTILIDPAQKKKIEGQLYENGLPSNQVELQQFLSLFTDIKQEVDAKKQEVDAKKQEVDAKKQVAEDTEKKEKNMKESFTKLDKYFNEHSYLLEGSKKQEWERCKEFIQKGQPNAPVCRDFALWILRNLDAKAQATKDPEERRKIYADISSVATTFRDLGAINDTELNSFLGAVDKSLKTSTDVGTKVAVNEGFERRGADYIKTVGNTSDILGFDEKGAPKEKIMSRESGFTIDVPVKPEHALMRDMQMLGSKITETTSQLEQVEKYSKELELLKGKPVRTENEEKKLHELENINLRAVKERLSKRLEILQDRMKQYEREARNKPVEMEQYEKTKESQRKKVEFYDAIGLTRFGKHAESLVKTIGQLSDDIFPPKVGDGVGTDRKEQEHFLKVFGLLLGKEWKNLSFDMNTIPPMMRDKFLKNTADFQDMLIKRWILIGEKGGDTKMTSYELIKQKLLEESFK